MDNEQMINVVWCDDHIDEVYNKSVEGQFTGNGCSLYRRFKKSNDLLAFLKEPANRNCVDAVIVDFNVDNTSDTADTNVSRGFFDIRRVVGEYSPLPFYLYSGMKTDFINQKYTAHEEDQVTDYFFTQNSITKRENRFFTTSQQKELITEIIKEVNGISNPEYVIKHAIRNMFRDGFMALKHFDESGEKERNYMEILLAKDSIDRFNVSPLAGYLRDSIEFILGKLRKKLLVPKEIRLNNLPQFFSGNDRFKEHYEGQEMAEPLADAFSWFLNNAQKAKHDSEETEIHEYCNKTGDIYLVHSLALIGLDVIKWLKDFEEENEDKHPFPEYYDVIIDEESTTTTGRRGWKAHEKNDNSLTFFIMSKERKFEHNDVFRVSNWNLNTDKNLTGIKFFVKLD